MMPQRPTSGRAPGYAAEVGGVLALERAVVLLRHIYSPSVGC
jgi:hypothetical protein